MGISCDRFPTVPALLHDLRHYTFSAQAGSPIVLQVTSRVWVVWGIMVAAPAQVASSGITVIPLGQYTIELNLSSLLLAWSITEIVRYSFFAFKVRLSCLLVSITSCCHPDHRSNYLPIRGLCIPLGCSLSACITFPCKSVTPVVCLTPARGQALSRYQTSKVNIMCRHPSSCISTSHLAFLHTVLCHMHRAGTGSCHLPDAHAHHYSAVSITSMLNPMHTLTLTLIFRS